MKLKKKKKNSNEPRHQKKKTDRGGSDLELIEVKEEKDRDGRVLTHTV